MKMRAQKGQNTEAAILAHRISWIFAPIAILLIVRSSNAQTATAPTSPPTMEQLRELYDSGDYRTCIQQVAGVMRLTGAAAKPYDREQLQLLRGETLIALNDPATAKRVLQEASKSSQPDVAIRARGLVALLSKSRGSIYTPRSGGGKPLDISDPENRKRALEAMVTDEIGGLEAAAKPAQSADNLKPIIQIMPRVLDLNAVERLATGEDVRTRPIGAALGERARKLIGSELAAQAQRIQGIEQLANGVYDTGRTASSERQSRRGTVGAGVTRRGLNSDEREELYNLVEYLRQVEDTAKGAERMARMAQGDVAAWEEISAQASRVAENAQAVLDAEGVSTTGN